MASKGSPPKKKPFLSVGAPGKGIPHLASGMWPEKQPTTSRNPLAGGTAGAAPATASGPTLESNSAGRPPSNLGKYLIKPSATALSGFEMLNQTPDAIDAVHKKYLKAQELPPHLQPVRFHSPTLEHNRSLAISRGWRKPRSRAG